MWDIIENKANFDTGLLMMAYTGAIYPVIKDLIAEFLLRDALEKGEY